MARSAARAAPAVVRSTTPPRPSAAPAPVAVPAAGRSARPAPGPPAVRLTAIGTAHPATLPDVPAGGGEAIPEAVQGQLNVSLKADLKVIRLHTNPQAQELARSLSARAVTYGRDIFLGPGEQPTDVELIGHEVAHVIQQQGVPQVQRWSNAPEDACEREARSASSAVVRGEPFTVRERTTSPRVQRLGLSDVLDYFADKANNIPGFRMFTIVLGVNPINWSRVERSAANILRALIEFLPGGKLITDALNEYGIFDKIGNWVEQQLKTLGDIGASIKKAIGDFLDSLGWRDIFRLGSVWNRAKRIFTDPITRIIDFGKGLVIGILKFIKEAILKPLAKLAEKTRGYDLLKAVIGEDPVTGEKVPRTPDTLIGGFMKLIGQEEVWNNIKKANAIGRAWTWFQGVLSGLLGFVRQIPALFIAALKSLELFDVVLPPRAFVKLARVFGNFIVKFLSWGLQQVFGLLQIIFEVVAPGAVPYIRKAAGAFKKIIENPVGFIRNLVRAGIQGFKQFAANFLGHLRKSLIEWLTGTMSGANIHIPQAFTLSEIIKFVLSVLGLTWQNIRGKLVKAIGEPAVKALETGFDIVVTLVKEGPAAAWDKIVQAVTNLKEMVIEEAMNFVKRRVVEAAIQKLLTSLNPAGAFIQAIIAIYNTIMFFVERLKQIARVAMAFIDSIAAIASGVIAAAANKVETTMAGLLTLVISFLARIAGLGKVSDAVKDIINRVRAPIDKGLDKVIEWIVAQGKKLGKLVATAGVPQDPNERLRLGLNAATAAVDALRGPVVTAALITPVLGAIKVRYGFRTLQPVEQNEEWWVEGEINPKEKRKTKKKKRVSKEGKEVAKTLIGKNIESVAEFPEEYRKVKYGGIADISRTGKGLSVPELSCEEAGTIKEGRDLQRADYPLIKAYEKEIKQIIKDIKQALQGDPWILSTGLRPKVVAGKHPEANGVRAQMRRIIAFLQGPDRLGFRGVEVPLGKRRSADYTLEVKDGHTVKRVIVEVKNWTTYKDADDLADRGAKLTAQLNAFIALADKGDNNYAAIYLEWVGFSSLDDKARKKYTGIINAAERRAVKKGLDFKFTTM